MLLWFHGHCYLKCILCDDLTGSHECSTLSQISGAKLRLLEGHPGSSESIVEIQGTLDQAKAAQSLLEGFISANSRSTQQQPQPSRMPLYPSWG